jgi:hypothetical protein
MMSICILEEYPTVRHYALWGGGRIHGDSPQSLVDALRASSFHPCRSRAAFLEEISERCRFYNGATISTWDDENFIADLIHNGFLKEIDPLKPDNVVPFENPDAEDKQ